MSLLKDKYNIVHAQGYRDGVTAERNNSATLRTVADRAEKALNEIKEYCDNNPFRKEPFDQLTVFDIAHKALQAFREREGV